MMDLFARTFCHGKDITRQCRNIFRIFFFKHPSQFKSSKYHLFKKKTRLGIGEPMVSWLMAWWFNCCKSPKRIGGLWSSPRKKPSWLCSSGVQFKTAWFCVYKKELIVQIYVFIYTVGIFLKKPSNEKGSYYNQYHF